MGQVCEKPVPIFDYKPKLQLERRNGVKKQNRKFVVISLVPALLCFVFLFVYPAFRTLIQSFFSMKQLSDPVSRWTFAGIENYVELFNTPIFMTSLINIGKIWIIGGVITILLALMFAVILTSGVKGKKFFRSLIYLPNVISSVAMVNMWSLYIYNNKYGLLTSLFTKLGIENLASINWTDSGHMFGSMLVAYCFGYIGYLMLILMAGIENIPNELYESATIDGANGWIRFRYITLPLIREVFRTCLMFWTISTIGFFVWSQLWSVSSDLALLTPMLYMYNLTFNTSTTGIASKNIGVGCAICVVMMVIVMISYVVFNVILKERKYEY